MPTRSPRSWPRISTNSRKRRGFSITGRKRGNGWVAASLTEVLQSLPPTHPKYARLVAGYKIMMAGLKATQGADGLWHQLLDDPDAWALLER